MLQKVCWLVEGMFCDSCSKWKIHPASFSCFSLQNTVRCQATGRICIWSFVPHSLMSDTYAYINIPHMQRFQKSVFCLNLTSLLQLKKTNSTAVELERYSYQLPQLKGMKRERSGEKIVNFMDSGHKSAEVNIRC